MKMVRLLFFFLLAVLVVVMALTLILPTSQKVERSVVINAPAAVIYQELIKLENFNKYSVWAQQDSAATYTLSGTDGTVGAVSSWSGHPEISGDGKIEITALEENKSVTHQLHFTRPKEGNASSVFSLMENNGLTTVTWNFALATPRPWNIFNLFYSMDKEMGKDFEYGLSALKKAIESTNGIANTTTYEVNRMDFPATTFAVIRQKINWNDIQPFFAEHLPIIYKEALKANASPGTAAGLFYTWDEKNQQTDLAAAFPVNKDSRINNNIINLTGIPASKAIYVNYFGDYDKAAGAINNLNTFINTKKLKQKYPIIWQYITDPALEKDTAKWLTKIVYLIE
jgi:effector-binding domain-containing protein